MRSPGSDTALAAPASAARTSAGTRAAIAARAAGAALRLRARLVQDEIPVPEKAPVEHLDRLGGFLFRRHLDESEAPRPARELVRDDPDRLHGSRLREQLAKVLLRGLEGEVTYEQLCGHRATLLALTKAAMA